MRCHQAPLPEAALPSGAPQAEHFEVAAAGYVRISLDHFTKSDDEPALRASFGSVSRNF